MTGISRIDYHKLRPFIPYVFLILIFLLIMVLLGPESAGSRRSFYNYGQPSEFMKLMGQIIITVNSILAD